MFRFRRQLWFSESDFSSSGIKRAPCLELFAIESGTRAPCFGPPSQIPVPSHQNLIPDPFPGSFAVFVSRVSWKKKLDACDRLAFVFSSGSVMLCSLFVQPWPLSSSFSVLLSRRPANPICYDDRFLADRSSRCLCQVCQCWGKPKQPSPIGALLKVQQTVDADESFQNCANPAPRRRPVL